MANPEAWPELPLTAWRATRDTLRMWIQAVGKIRLGRALPIDHWWRVPGLCDGARHEVSSCRFWPSGAGMGEPIFYSYAYPEATGFLSAPLSAAAARYSREFGEFIFPYDAVRQTADPDAALLEFLEGTYDAAAGPAPWDRASLERRATS